MSTPTDRPTSAVSRVALWLLLPAALAVGTFAATDRLNANPRIDAPEILELGEFDDNTHTGIDLPVSNTGVHPLELSQFEVSCSSCIHVGVRQKEGGTPSPSSVTVSPGEAAPLIARITVTGSPSMPFSGFIAFRTNDPQRPRVSIRLAAKVRGRWQSVPDRVSLNRVEVGSAPAGTMVRLFDSALTQPRMFGRVEVEPTGLFQVSFAPATDLLPPGQKMSTHGAWVGDCTVTPVASLPAGPIHATLKCYPAQADAPALEVPLSALLVPRVEATPSELFLPRRSESGPIYQAECVCRGPLGKATAVTPGAVPEGITMTRTSQGRGETGFRVVVDPKVVRGDPVIEFRVEGDGVKEVLRVPVRLSREPNP